MPPPGSRNALWRTSHWAVKSPPAAAAGFLVGDELVSIDGAPYSDKETVNRLMADQQGLSYGLRLPALAVAPSSGEAHRRACLEALALC